MRQIKDPILFTLFLLVCGCATHGTSEVSVTTDKPALTKPQADKWQMMVGKWYGDQQTSEGGRKEWIDHRKNDGTYVIQFRITSKDGEVQQSVEAGEWGVSGPIYFSIFKAWV